MVARRTPTLSAEQLSEVLSLIKGADSVELKLSVPDEDQRSVVAALGMDPVEADIRQVSFFDTPDLDLDKHGVVVRARRVQRKPADSVVKLRPVDPHELPASLRKLPGFGVEVDAKPGGYEAFDTAAKTKAFLAGHGVDLASTQQTKTRTALQYFATNVVG